MLALGKHHVMVFFLMLEVVVPSLSSSKCCHLTITSMDYLPPLAIAFQVDP